jgi:hypothetical protein
MPFAAKSSKHSSLRANVSFTVSIHPLLYCVLAPFLL